MPHTKVLRPKYISATTYLLLGAAGVVFLFWEPSTLLQQMMGHFKFILWNLFLMCGGIIGIAGAWTKIYRLEAVALPFVGTGVLVYGVTLIPRLDDPGTSSPGALLGITLIFFAAVTELAGRGWELYNVIRISNKLRRRTRE